MEIEVKITLTGTAPRNLQNVVRELMLLFAAKLIEASVNSNNNSASG